MDCQLQLLPVPQVAIDAKKYRAVTGRNTSWFIVAVGPGQAVQWHRLSPMIAYTYQSSCHTVGAISVLWSICTKI